MFSNKKSFLSAAIVLSTMTFLSVGCGGDDSGGSSSSISTTTPTTTTPDTTTATSCASSSIDLSTGGLWRYYSVVDQFLFQVGDSDFTNGKGTYGCYNGNGSYALSDVSGTDTNNYSATYTLTNCVSKAQAPYSPSVPAALTGTYKVVKSGSANNYTFKITPVTDIKASDANQTTPYPYTITPSGSKSVTLVNGAISNVKYSSFAYKGSSGDTITANLDVSYSSSGGTYYTKTITSGNIAGSTSGTAWGASFQTSTPLYANLGVWPNITESGAISVSGGGQSGAISYYGTSYKYTTSCGFTVSGDDLIKMVTR